VRRLSGELLSNGIATSNQADIGGALQVYHTIILQCFVSYQANHSYMIDTQSIVQRFYFERILCVLTYHICLCCDCLQVFFNLGCLSEKVKSCCTRLIDTCDAHITKALQQSTLLQLEQATTSLTTGTTTASSNNASNTTGSSSTSASITTAAPTSSTKQQTAALQRQKRLKYKEHAEQLCSALYECCIQAWNVNKVLGIMVDTSASSGTHRTFLQVRRKLQRKYFTLLL
jgi:hypothetical protein